MTNMYKAVFITFIHFLVSYGFIMPYMPLKKISKQNSHVSCSGDRVIYKNYLIGLRKTRRYISNTTNINKLISILNFTNEFVLNNTNINDTQPIIPSMPLSTEFNNTEVGLKTITAGNMILDVSNVEYIHISTKKDKIVIELDKNKNSHNFLNILDRINNIDTMINTLSLLTKLMNVG